MRNEQAHAYSLHHKVYRDKRSIYYLFSQEFGVIHGIGSRGTPQFVPLSLFVSGKKTLKNLQQVNISGVVVTLLGEQLYAGLYINEVLLKLLPIEEPFPALYEHYRTTLEALRQPLTAQQMRLVLRHFEHALFKSIGHSVDFYQDTQGHAIATNSHYQFFADKGWSSVTAQNSVAKPTKANSNINTDKKKTDIATTSVPMRSVASVDGIGSSIVSGSDIITMQAGITEQNLVIFNQIYRQMVDYLFDYKPLQSRLLWQQFNQYR